VKPLPINKISQAIVSVLERDPDLYEKVTIERSTIPNEDPSKCPWIGIYRVRSDFTVRALGLSNRTQATQFSIIVQESAANESTSAEDDHETLISRVLDAIFADPTLGGVVRTTTLASVDYVLVANKDEELLQSAQLLLTFETLTQ
jgi:hypothetical protein